ncbi:unnamed protein product [Prorocentrum cordatum]|uniref:EF-hand domain-containing protein n=1 Tax=Prorocentrum cordatum TaxID=2364126 RepID=A0ABN9SKY7_9DINO|nr:unnamed protein product [Polarella glacialis]
MADGVPAWARGPTACPRGRGPPAHGPARGRSPVAAPESLKAEDIGKMYATGDADMDELADTTWKDHFNVAFQSMDNDKDGKISLEDFAHALSEMGQPFTNLKQDALG